MARAIIPAWVAPAAQEVADCHRLAAATARLVERGTHGYWRVRAVAATLDWVVGVHPSPITDQPPGATLAQARAEYIAADYVASGWGEPPEGLWAELGVDRRSPTTTDAMWSTQVGQTLIWLVSNPRGAPLQLPRRHPDGRVLTEDDLYAEAQAAAGRIGWGPEERHAARQRAVQDAARYRRLADLAATV